MAPEPLQVKNGWIVREIIFSLTELIFAKNIPVLQDGGTRSLSQFVPGRCGAGYTKSQIVLRKYYCFSEHMCFIIITGLWYERRRNDHRRNMHADAGVWAPFNEMPYSRSGQGGSSGSLKQI